ncbi:haloacid dehalogenase-like hydrolase [Streptomyces sp. AD2-2]|nr:haloacid dehalogenase-like hydrolase [Streptomyces sp. AD2-2]
MSDSSTRTRTADLTALEKLPPPTAVVFDCDGTLMDTEPCADAARSAVFARRGHAYDNEARAALVGLSVAQGGKVMSNLFGGNASRLAEELTEELLAAVADGAQPMPGAAEILARVAARVPVAVASNAPACSWTRRSRTAA